LFTHEQRKRDAWTQENDTEIKQAQTVSTCLAASSMRVSRWATGNGELGFIGHRRDPWCGLLWRQCVFVRWGE